MKPAHQRNRGSLLIVAMLFSAIIAIALTSYLTIATHSLKLANRSFVANNAVNLAETGIEIAMTCINASTWGDWTVSGSNASRTITGFSFSQGASGSVKVVVLNYSTSNPTVISKSTVTPSTGATIEKMIAVSGFIQRSLFAKGLVGKHGLTFNGNNPSVDSWDSLLNDDGTARSSAAAYSSGIAHARGSIAAVDVTSTASVNNADIWGTASVGSSSSSAIDVGPQGRVGPFGTGNGVKNPDYISTNFTTNLPTITAPAPTAAQLNVYGSNINSDITLPENTATDKSVTDSTGKVTYYYSFPSMTGGTMTIRSGYNVVLLPTAGSGTDAIRLSGNHDAIVVNSGGTLGIYTPANISISGQASITNSNGSASSTSIQIWGTNTSSSSPGQSFGISGNGVLMCTCYAPNAAISAKGGGNSGVIYGAFVGYSITMTGNDAFHYDESLGRQGTSGTYTPTKWIELTKNSDRQTYASYF